MLANKQCIMIEGHWFNNSKIFSLLKNLEDTKLRIFFHNPDLQAAPMEPPRQGGKLGKANESALLEASDV